MASVEQTMKLKRTIVELFRLRMDPAQIADGEPLFGEGLGLDSVDAIELVTAVDRQFGVVIENEEQSRDAFRSVGALADYLVARGGRI